MFDEELFLAFKQRKVHSGKISINKNLFPSWDELIPYFDKSFLEGNERAKNPLKLVLNVREGDFVLSDMIRYFLQEITNYNITCHCYAGITPNCFSSPVHRDQMDVLFLMVKGTMPWKVYENGYDEENQKEICDPTFSVRFIPGDYIFMPKGTYHSAYPDRSRVGFSFGFNRSSSIPT